MDSRQKALIVTTTLDATRGLDELNVALGRGWRVVRATPMGGAGAGATDGESTLGFAVFVVIGQEENAGTALAEQEHEVEELIEEIIEGDGADVELADDFDREAR